MWLRRPKRSVRDFGFVNVGGYADDPTVQAQMASNKRAFEAYNAAKQADARRQFMQAGLTAAAVVGGPAAIGGAGGGGAALPSATSGIGTSGGYGGLFSGTGSFLGSSAAPVAPAVTTASRFTLPNLLKFAEIGVPAATQLLGMRSQNKAYTRQAAQEQANLQAQMDYAREQENFRRAEADRVATEERRRWEIEQQNRARELAAAEEDRAFNRRLIEEREARNQQRRMRLAQFLGLGR